MSSLRKNCFSNWLLIGYGAGLKIADDTQFHAAALNSVFGGPEAIRIGISGLKIAHLMEASNSPRHHFSNRSSVSYFKTLLDLILLPQREPGEARRGFPPIAGEESLTTGKFQYLAHPQFINYRRVKVGTTQAGKSPKL